MTATSGQHWASATPHAPRWTEACWALCLGPVCGVKKEEPEPAVRMERTGRMNELITTQKCCAFFLGSNNEPIFLVAAFIDLGQSRSSLTIGSEILHWVRSGRNPLHPNCPLGHQLSLFSLRVFTFARPGLCSRRLEMKGFCALGTGRGSGFWGSDGLDQTRVRDDPSKVEYSIEYMH